MGFEKKNLEMYSAKIQPTRLYFLDISSSEYSVEKGVQ